MGSMKSLAVSAVVLVSICVASAQTNDPVAIAAKVQQRYNGIKDISGDFVQTYEGGVLRTKTTERGTVAIKRPGRMRWVYTKPERKEFVSDGTRIYSYIPADKQVIVSPMPAGQTTTPALFLTGRGHLVRDFNASLTELPVAAPGTSAVRLVPKHPDPDVESLVLVVDSASLQLRQLVATDKQGGRSTFTFSNLKE